MTLSTSVTDRNSAIEKSQYTLVLLHLMPAPLHHTRVFHKTVSKRTTRRTTKVFALVEIAMERPFVTHATMVRSRIDLDTKNLPALLRCPARKRFLEGKSRMNHRTANRASTDRLCGPSRCQRSRLLRLCRRLRVQSTQQEQEVTMTVDCLKQSVRA